MKWTLPVIVISQFLCTCVWFADNAIISDLVSYYHLSPALLAHLTSAVQFGFISGTLIFAVLTISDRFSPSRVFFVSSVLAALFNLGLCLEDAQPAELLMFRFITGFFLAGIYPVGMKIASDYYQEGLGKSLGFLVGALVLGTGFAHLLKSASGNYPWQFVIYITSALSVVGGLAMLLLVPNGPYRRKSLTIKFSSFIKGFNNENFRSVAFGYFGHMWELYTFWAFVPLMLAAYNLHFPNAGINIPLLSFLIIGSGGVACVTSGLISQRFGAGRIASIALFLSGLCCLLSPFLLFTSSLPLFISFLFFWGLVVIADSPMFSTLVAKNASDESRGTSLTIVNCIGFSITIVSIQVVNWLSRIIDARYLYLVLAIGPILGLFALLRKQRILTA
jgi:MFS family permease